MNTTADRVKDTSKTHVTELTEPVEQKDYKAAERTAGKQGRSFTKDDEVRWDLVERIKAEIEAGTYVTEERLAATADRLADVLFPEFTEDE